MCPQVIFKEDNMFRFQQEINPFIIVIMDLPCLLLPNPTILPPKRPGLKCKSIFCLLTPLALLTQLYIFVFWLLIN